MLPLHAAWIPVETKIPAVSQTYAAMALDGPRRHAKEPAGAHRELATGIDEQFDALVVRAFLRVLEIETEGYRRAGDHRLVLPGLRPRHAPWRRTQRRRPVEAEGPRGVRLAMDDFGAGLRSPSYLRRLPVGSLKTDKGSVAGPRRDSRDAPLASGMIRIAHRLCSGTLARGVEDTEQPHGCWRCDATRSPGETMPAGRWTAKRRPPWWRGPESSA